MEHSSTDTVPIARDELVKFINVLKSSYSNKSWNNAYIIEIDQTADKKWLELLNHESDGTVPEELLL